MKKNVLCVALFATLILALFVTFNSTNNVSRISRLLMDSDVEALAYSNENPGGLHERHTQAVWCNSTFWNGWRIAEGCCYGWETCNVIKCGVHGSFTCDGNHWVSY